MTTRGECNCGAIQFEVDGDLSGIFVCHCSICRRATGSNGIAVVVVANDELRWVRGQDHITTWQKPNADWQTWFCRICGSPVPGRNDAARMFVPAGTITAGAEALRVSHHLWVGSKAAWDEIGDTGEQHREAFRADMRDTPEAPPKVTSLGWLGIRTAHAAAMSAFYRDVLRLELLSEDATSSRFRLGNGTEAHVYVAADPDHDFFGEGPVVGFAVRSFRAARSALTRAGIELIYPEPQRVGGKAWQHFRAPDGNVYEIIGPDDIDDC
jgi:catechol 2,3-dioxygenase-like lactoylglutathione lyase family enzyme